MKLTRCTSIASQAVQLTTYTMGRERLPEEQEDDAWDDTYGRCVEDIREARYDANREERQEAKRLGRIK